MSPISEYMPQRQTKRLVIETMCKKRLSCLVRFMWRKHPNFDKIGITLINSLWPDSIPSKLDAAYQNVGMNLMVFFKGIYYLITHMPAVKLMLCLI